jgi:hypothetical protein
MVFTGHHMQFPNRTLLGVGGFENQQSERIFGKAGNYPMSR